MRSVEFGGPHTVTSWSGCGAVAWSARRLWASSGPPGGRRGQAVGRQRLCELAGGVRSPPRRPPPLKVPVPAPGQPQFTQPFPPTPDKHTHARAHTHSGGGFNGVGGHTVVTKKCSRSLWLLTGAQRLPLLGIGRPPAFREAGKERPATCACLYLKVPGAQRTNPCLNSGITSPWRTPFSGFPL